MDTQVQIMWLTTNQEDGSIRFVDNHKLFIIIPIVRGLPIQKPILDYINTIDGHFIHQTILIEAISLMNSKRFYLRIRMKVDQVKFIIRFLFKLITYFFFFCS